jgi:DNA-directed RNA polymerase I, II, and III subunit RPABC2
MNKADDKIEIISDIESEIETDDDESVDGGIIKKFMKKGVISGGYDDINNSDEEEEYEEDEEEYEKEEDPENYEENDIVETGREVGNPKLIIQTNEDLDEEDDEDEEEDYLQKVSEQMKENIITNYHPELKAFNNEEVEAACNIVRGPNGDIIDPLHRTLPFVTKYEKARIIGERAKQINAGAKPFIEVDKKVHDGYLIALKEYEEKKIPFIVRRPLPNGTFEFWRLRDLDILE